MSEVNKELVRRMYEEAWNEGRLDVVTGDRHVIESTNGHTGFLPSFIHRFEAHVGQLGTRDPAIMTRTEPERNPP